ncbi:ComEA family DNA-binding protein [Paenibacillus glycanilyticus]|uniref:Helix-hairpin-helix DNA-binding motif class 1 domain-containing protein n=1 Tax=Paenibacillus glycanilyticus TaxID=126569 RepID=A0ABQ6GE17_9BACL|nr:ComEA family DNA-binding protein [Paenibacillus glycanilyticus]GLX69204.1 hypothetical protein MU1_35490 [Paenibacillus glycanilyticus]
MARFLNGRRTNSNRSSWIVPLLLIAAAAVLIMAALAQPKEKPPEDWVQLNREVESALNVHEVKEADAQAAQKPVTTGLAEEAVNTEGPEKAKAEEVEEEAEAEEVEAEAEAEDKQAAKSEVEAGSGLIDINRASVEQLDTLKGIGPSKARAIIANREQNGLFRSVDDLLRVKGIGDKLLAGIKDGIVAKP